MGKKTRNVRRKIGVSKLPVAKLQRKLWVLCKLLTRKIHGNECYTCGVKNLESSNWQTGHLIPKSTCGAYLKYDLRILRPQCLACNIWRGGEGAEFLRKMIIREGQDYVDKIFQDKHITLSPKAAYEHYEMQTEKYKLMLETENFGFDCKE